MLKSESGKRKAEVRGRKTEERNMGNMAQNKPRSWRRGVLKIVAGLVVFLVAAGVLAWLFPQQVLTVDSGPVKADVLVVLGGTPDRAARAAELFKEGAAPRILVSGFGDAGSNKQLLEREGVPAKAIILEGKSRTTQQNAELSIALLRQMGAKRVIIVTTWYHSRRGLMCFEHYAPEIQFYSRPSYWGYVGKMEDGGPKTDDRGQKIDNGKATPHPTLSPVEAERARAKQKAEWKQVRVYANAEYVKLLGYWVLYGVCPI
jgi:uncharacterized SAM-binding protein YcdF (DUF218 family)